MSALLLTVAILGATPTLHGTETHHAGILVAQADAPVVSKGFDGWTHEQLQTEYTRLEDSRPSIVGSVVMLSIGGVLLIPGAYCLIVGITTGSSTLGLGYVLAVIGGIMVVPGVILAIVGAVKLMNRLSEQKAIDGQTAELKQRMGAMAPPASMPDRTIVQTFVGIEPSMVVATF
jgi:hypothetical protein